VTGRTLSIGTSAMAEAADVAPPFATPCWCWAIQARTLLPTTWNATVDKRPGVIIQCAGAADVIAAVNFLPDDPAWQSR
jgi:hypothetical protein